MKDHACPVIRNKGARVFEVDAGDPVAILKMERAENEHRVDLTPSEKVELAKRMEEALGNRAGRPKKDEEEIKEHVPEFKGKQTRDVAAEAVGWKPSGSGIGRG